MRLTRIWIWACVVGCNSATSVAIQPTPPTPPKVESRAPVVDAAAPSGKVPTLVAESFAPTGTKPRGLFAIEGALMVIDGMKVGRINGDAIEVLGTVPQLKGPLGSNSIDSVVGRYPDAVGAISSFDNGRAPAPMFFPIGSKGVVHQEAAGGGLGTMLPARVGDSIVLATHSSFDGTRLVTVHGPRVVRTYTSAKAAGCTLQELYSPPSLDGLVAVEPAVFESTRDGTLVSFGTLCAQRRPAAEIWDKTTGKSRIVDVPSAPYSSWRARFLKAKGDDLWLYLDELGKMLRFHDGQLTPLPLAEEPLTLPFASPAGDLYGYAPSGTIYRFDGSRWSPAAKVTPPLVDATSVAVDDGGNYWAGARDKVLRLKPNGESSAIEDCKSWFVYLFRPSGQNRATYTYPTTQKALAGIPGLKLVVTKAYPERVGVEVKDRAQGNEVIAAVKANMKDEDPRLFCWAPPADSRRIDVAPE